MNEDTVLRLMDAAMKTLGVIIVFLLLGLIVTVTATWPYLIFLWLGIGIIFYGFFRTSKGV